MSVRVWLLGLVVISTLSFTNADFIQAIAIMQSPFGGKIEGNITFSQNDQGTVTIFGRMTGLTPGKHGIHIHETGDIRSCGWTGAHYNPHKRKHGGLLSKERHVGDLGNFEAQSDGVASLSITDHIISLKGPYSIIGRSVVTTANEDDNGVGGFPDSFISGHSGYKEACGVIGLLTRLDSVMEDPFSPAPSCTPVPMISLLVATILIWLNF